MAPAAGLALFAKQAQQSKERLFRLARADPELALIACTLAYLWGKLCAFQQISSELLRKSGVVRKKSIPTAFDVGCAFG